jgi:SAM-dependent methyltransferase
MLLRRRMPVSPYWGFDRGTPVDRYYIEHFLREHGGDIRGIVLEVQDRLYTTRFGTGVEQSDVLDIDAGNPAATIVADLARADNIAADTFDCFVLTQTLQLVYDVQAAIAHCHRILRPGGVLLATVPAASRVVGNPDEPLDYWRFTTSGCRRLFGERFGQQNVSVQALGSMAAVVAFLYGMAREEIPRRRLDLHDPRFPLIVAVRAVKS